LTIKEKTLPTSPHNKRMKQYIFKPVLLGTVNIR